MLKKYLFVVWLLAIQNCNSMREYRMSDECQQFTMKLNKAIFDKTNKWGMPNSCDDRLPNVYDRFIDKFEENIPNGGAEIDFALYNCNYSKMFYAIKDEICVIANHILGIGKQVFCENHSFSTVKLPEKLLGIGCMAFAYTDIEELYIPESVVAIAPFAFAKCEKLKNVNISKNTTIMNGAFAMSPNVVLRYRDVKRSKFGV